MIYKNSIPKNSFSEQTEFATYIGNFSHGKREGYGEMFWTDGSNFKGTWHHDERHQGRMVMANGQMYEGYFKNDRFHDPKGRLFLETQIIYQGKFDDGKTSPIATLLFPSGDIYYGQI